MLHDRSELKNFDVSDSQFFKRNGFLIKHQYFASSQVSVMKENSERYLSEFNKTKTLIGEDFLYEDSTSTLRLVRNVHKKNNFFHELAFGHELASFAEHLTGFKPTLLNTKLNFKNAFTGEQFDWHQDSIYLGEENKNSIAFVVAIDTVTHENGPMILTFTRETCYVQGDINKYSQVAGPQ